jgi:hypothetical protein
MLWYVGFAEYAGSKEDGVRGGNDECSAAVIVFHGVLNDE